MSQLEDLRQYLGGISIDPAEKNFAFDFCKKNEYITQLMQAVIQNVNGVHVSMGYGNLNSKIVMVFPNENSLSVMKSTIQKLLDKFHIDFWSLYITFIDKTEAEYPLKFNVLMNEINAISPQIIYFVDKDDSQIVNLKIEFNKYGIKLPKHYLLEAEKLVNDTEQNRKEIWKSFKYAINYKDLPKQ